MHLDALLCRSVWNLNCDGQIEGSRVQIRCDWILNLKWVTLRKRSVKDNTVWDSHSRTALRAYGLKALSHQELLQKTIAISMSSPICNNNLFIISMHCFKRSSFDWLSEFFLSIISLKVIPFDIIPLCCYRYSCGVDSAILLNLVR